jgi:hypothetical protein
MLSANLNSGLNVAIAKGYLHLSNHRKNAVFAGNGETYPDFHPGCLSTVSCDAYPQLTFLSARNVIHGYP